MDPLIGQSVKILFNNGTAVEGTVVQWSDDKSVIKSINKESLFVIQKTKQDVLAVIIRLNDKKVEKESIQHSIDMKKSASVDKKELEKQYEDIKNNQNDDLRIKKLVELKSELNQLEKEEFFNRFRGHEMTQIGSVGNYVLPNISKKPRIVERSSEENQRKNVRNHSKLSKMFARKNKDSG